VSWAERSESLLLLPPSYLLLTVVVGCLGFMVSATFGIGGVIVLIPVLSLRLPPAEAVAISAPVMLVNNVGKTVVYRRFVDWRACALVSALGIPVAALAALFTAQLNDTWILLGVSTFILISIAVERWHASWKISAVGLVGWGAVTGAISGLCGAAGPPTAIGLRGYGLNKEAFVATVSVFAVGLQLAKLPAYWGTGLLAARHFWLVLMLSIVAGLSVVVGPTLLRRMPARWFRSGVDAVLLLSALWMIIDATRRQP
jgi:uncharacterized protein